MTDTTMYLCRMPGGVHETYCPTCGCEPVNGAPTGDELANALRVMVLTPGIRAHLEANDPKALEQAEAALAKLPNDPRYDRVRCGACGQVYQNIDFGCAVHRLTCDKVEQAARVPVDEATAAADLPATVDPDEKHPTIQGLMNSAYKQWQTEGGAANWKRERFYDSLNYAEKIAVYCGNLNYQVENGGFAQYFHNGYPNEEVIGFLDRFLLEVGGKSSLAVRDLLLKFWKIVGGKDHRCDVGDYDADRLDYLDSVFYTVNAGLLDEVEMFLVADTILHKPR